MGKHEAKAAYQHFVPPVKKVENWQSNFNFVLVESMSDLEKIFSSYESGKYFMSFDTETTGLDAEELELVGYSFCLDGKTAYYVPVYHFEYPGNLGEPAVEFIYKKMCEARKVFVFNMKFDFRVFEYRGYKEHKEELDKKRWLYVKYDMSKVPYFDVAIPVWLADTNIKLPSLKWAATHFLGIDMMHFDEVTESAGNFFYLNPSENSDTVFYAASDALMTYLLVPATMKYFNESGLAGKIDNKVLYPLMHYEHEKLWLDKDKIDSLVVSVTEEVDRLERAVYDSLGYQINLNSPAQVSQAFERLGIDTGQRTAKGFMKTGIDDLEALPESVREQYPALDMFVKYKILFKLNSSYISVLKKEADTKGFLRGAYKTQQVPTGRLAAGKDAKNSFFSPINLQALPKPHVVMYDVFYTGDRNLFSKKGNILFGYKFVVAQYDENRKHIVPDDDNYVGWAEGMNPKNNVRACITPKMYEDSGDDEFVYCAVDYAAQELRIPANLSREPAWVDAFVSGGDVHKSTAVRIWGEENYNKDYRKMAKGANFCETASSFVLTDKGYLHPYDITPKETLITRQGTDTIDNIVMIKDEPCIRIKFDNGVEGTYHERHKLYVWNGYAVCWVEVRNLTNQHQVLGFLDKRCNVKYMPCMTDLKEYTDVIREPEKYAITIDTNSRGFAYLMGMYLGKGDISVEHRQYEMDCYTIRQKTSWDMVERVEQVISSLGFERDTIVCSDVDGESGNRILTYGGQGLGAYVHGHFGEGKSKKIPDFIFFDWDSEAIKALIDGLIESSGHDGIYRSKIHDISKSIVSRVALLCNYVGYRTYSIKEGDSDVLYIYKSSLANNDLKEFSSRDGTKMSTTSGYYPVSIVSKEYVTEDIYAIQCPKHEYIANGLNSHNSILYGAAAQSFADNPMYHMNLSEAEEFYNKYKKALPTLFQWEERLQRRGRRDGYVSTYFGRPRRVKGYFDNRNFAFANRTIVNTTVQGTASDMLKIVLCKLWTNLLNHPDYKDDVKWIVTIHDEVGYAVRASRANEIVSIIEDTQRVKLPEWPVVIDVEASCGWNMGSVFAMHKVQDNSDLGFHYEPKLD